MSGGRNTFSITGDFDALDAYFDALGEVAEQEAQPAAKAAADVLYAEVQRNVAQIGRKTGNLANSIYRAYAKEDSIHPGMAGYNISWRTSGGSGLARAPHGHWLEYGWLQRYKVVLTAKGEWRTAIRPEMRGKPKPKRRASQAAKDAYYVPRPGGPKQQPGRAFIRGAAVKFPEALAAAEEHLMSKLLGVG